MNDTTDRDARTRAITELLGQAQTTTEINAVIRVGLRAGYLWRCPVCKEANYADREACCRQARPLADD